MGELDRELVEIGLKRTASADQRLAALIESGFSIPYLGQICGVTEVSVRGWVKDKAMPRQKSEEKLDTLRGAMAKLVLQKGLAPDEAYYWMRSMPEDPPYVRPVDMLESPEGAVELMATIDGASFNVQ